jgi:phage terminase small subunit
VKRKGINPRELAFVDAYMTNGGNQKLAAISAGYPEHTSNHTRKIMDSVYVREEIARRRGIISVATNITIERTLRELFCVLTVDPAQAFDQDTQALLPIHEWPEDLRRAVSGIDSTEIFGPEGEVTGRARKVRFWSKTDAADKILKVLGGYLRPLLDPKNDEALQKLFVLKIGTGE